jgi:hypothetical protein
MRKILSHLHVLPCVCGHEKYGKQVIHLVKQPTEKKNKKRNEKSSLPPSSIPIPEQLLSISSTLFPTPPHPQKKKLIKIKNKAEILYTHHHYRILVWFKAETVKRKMKIKCQTPSKIPPCIQWPISTP